MNLKEKLFVNYNVVKGAQKFLKEAGFLKYANEEMEDQDANAVAAAMADTGMEVPEEAAMDDNSVLEVANTLIDLAQTQPSPAKEQIEQAAAEVATAIAPAGEMASESEMEEENESPLEEKQEEIKEAKVVATKIAQAFAAKMKRAMDDDITNKKPEQVLTPSGTDYQRSTDSANAPGTGTTTLKTEKGEIGAQENVEGKIVETVAPTATLEQKSEGEDIYAKDYSAPGKGGTTLKTEKGEQGSEENVESKIAKLAMEENLKKMLSK